MLGVVGVDIGLGGTVFNHDQNAPLARLGRGGGSLELPVRNTIRLPRNKRGWRVVPPASCFSFQLFGWLNFFFAAEIRPSRRPDLRIVKAPVFFVCAGADANDDLHEEPDR